MKRSVKYVLFAALFVFMTACPFEAPFPIDEPSVEYPEALLGTWATESALEEDNPTYYKVESFSDYSFVVTEYTYDSDEEGYTESMYDGHLSNIGDYKFLNLYDYTYETYYFYRMDWDDPETFSLYAVTEYIDEEFDSSEEMKIFFEKHCELSFFYQSAETYVKTDM